MRVLARILLVSVTLAVLSIPASVYAQSSIPSRLSLTDALRLASERNPRIAAARVGVDAAQADRLGARARPNPAVTLDSESYPLFESPRPAFFDNQELTFRFDQEIETAGRRRLRVQAAEFGVGRADATRRNVERQILLEVRRAYLQAALAQADLDAARGALSEIDRTLTLNRARLQQGEISGAEVRRLQAERLRFVDDVFASQLAVRNAAAALLTLVSAQDLGQAVEIADPLRPPDMALPATADAPAAVPPAEVSRLRQQALASRPDVLAAVQAEQRADTETRLQRAIRSPNITVGGGYKRDFMNNTVVFGVTVPLPLFNRNQGGIARADAERRIAQLDRAATEAEVGLDVQQAVNAVEVSRARVAYIEREYLDNAQQSVEIVRSSYQLGSADLIDLLDAQRTYRETRRTYNRALYELRVNQFQLDAAVGRDALAQ